MPSLRRCLVPGCNCKGYTLNSDASSMVDEETDLVESEKDELQSFCVLCGHPEEEHELAPSE
jgi:hypothetical protein